MQSNPDNFEQQKQQLLELVQAFEKFTIQVNYILSNMKVFDEKQFKYQSLQIYEVSFALYLDDIKNLRNPQKVTLRDYFLRALGIINEMLSSSSLLMFFDISLTNPDYLVPILKDIYSEDLIAFLKNFKDYPKQFQVEIILTRLVVRLTNKHDFVFKLFAKNLIDIVPFETVNKFVNSDKLVNFVKTLVLDDQFVVSLNQINDCFKDLNNGQTKTELTDTCVELNEILNLLPHSLYVLTVNF
jgi:hypothetical protein